jgi:hypothetical protein
MKKFIKNAKIFFVGLCVWLVPIALGWISWVCIESWAQWQIVLSPGDWGWFGRIVFGMCSVGWTILVFVAIFTSWGEEKKGIKHRGV